jgi:hypothetical protein
VSQARTAVPSTLQPVVLVPVGVDENALDACLAALESSTAAGTRVWLADDAQAGPRASSIIEAWLGRTRLQAAHTRRARSIGEAAHLDEALRACGDADVAILAADARPTPGWLQQLTACLARDPTIATATPWSNAGEAAAWPRIGEIVRTDEDPSRLARACAHVPATHPELPAAVSHAVMIRGSAFKRAGGIDAASFHSWYAALTDLSLRLSGLGWRNALCETAFVLRDDEGHALAGDMDRLSVRWPGWHARLAQCLMHDPLHEVRKQLHDTLAGLDSRSPQADLFPEPS